jgi:porin
MKEVLRRSKSFFLLVMVVCWFCIGARAYAEAAPDFNSTKLTGDWGGERTKLYNSGINFDIGVDQTYQGVLDGGTNKSWKYGGLVDYRFKFDFQKMGLWPGGFLDVQVEHQFGEFINSDTGAMVPVNTDGILPLPDYRQVNVDHVQFTQFLSESLAVFLGKIHTVVGYQETAFNGGEGKTTFMNTSNIIQPVAFRTVPLSALGGGVVIFLPDVTAKDHAILSFMVLGANGMPNTSGFGKDFDDGEVYLAAYRQPSRFFDKPGGHLFQATYSTKNFTLLDQDPRLLLEALLGFPVTLEKEDSSWSLMYDMYQYIYTEKEDETQGFGLFARIGTADDKTNPVANFYSAGLGGKGMINGRDNDTWGIGYFYTQLSHEFGRIIERNFGDSQGVEAFYNFEVTKWLHITPDFQIIEPSNEHVDTAYIAGFRVRMDF